MIFGGKRRHCALGERKIKSLVGCEGHQGRPFEPPRETFEPPREKDQISGLWGQPREAKRVGLLKEAKKNFSLSFDYLTYTILPLLELFTTRVRVLFSTGISCEIPPHSSKNFDCHPCWDKGGFTSGHLQGYIAARHQVLRTSWAQR